MAVLVEMDVGSTTHRYSVAGLAVDGHYYDGRLADMPPMTSSIGSPHAPELHEPQVTLRFKDSDLYPPKDRFLTIARNNDNLISAVFRIYSGEGLEKDDYALLFTGRVYVPGGLVFTKDYCEIDLVKEVHRRNRGVPNEQFGVNHASGAPADAYIPRVFGDYTRSPEQFLPTIALGSGEFYVADPDDITSIGTVKDDDGNTYSTSDYTYADGVVAISGSNPPPPSKLFVSVEGAHGTNAGDDKAEDMARWLITEVIGDAASTIDDTSFAAMGDLTRDIRCRAYFGDQDPGRQPEAVDVLHRLISNLFYDLIFTQDNKYKAVRRSIITGTIERSLADPDFFITSGRNAYQYASDPDKVLANRIFVNYALNPEDGAYDETFQQDEVHSQANLGNVFTRTLQCPYFYEAHGPQNLADLYLAVFGSEIYDFRNVLDGLDSMQPGDQIYVNTEDQIDKLPVQVRTVEWDLIRKKTAFECFALLSLSFKLFAPDSIDDYGTATDEQKEVYAFFTDDSGEFSDGTEGTKYAPGGAFVMAYMTVSQQTIDDSVKASLFNQLAENIAEVYSGKMKIAYGSGTDFMGARLLVDDSETPEEVAWFVKKNTEPDNVTVANADYKLALGETDPSGGPGF